MAKKESKKKTDKEKNKEEQEKKVEIKKEEEKQEEKAIEPEVVGEFTKDEKMMGMLAHILGMAASFVGPLIIYLIKKDESKFVEANSREALNFQISMTIAGFIIGSTAMLCFVTFFMIPLIVIVNMIFCIQGAIAANEGKMYKYPINFPFVSDPEKK